MLFLPHYLGAALSAPSLESSPWDVVVACFVIGAVFLTRAVNDGGLSTTYVIALGCEAVISVGIGLALLGERLTVSQAAGVGIVLVGLATLKHG